MNWPNDTVFPDAICMICRKECDKSEAVWTGDDDAYAGWETWGYCKSCDIDTFHPAFKQALKQK